MDWDSKMPPWDFAEFKRGDNCSADLKLGVAFMDWDLKMPPWDFAEFKRGDNYSADLKLGGLGDFRPSDKWNNQQSVVSTVAMVSSSSGSSKRARAPTKGSQIASCLVDGCVSDLSKCRDYHRRHKVCEIHSRTAIVMVRGQEQRFCQQCSRFHLLVEFDEVKRSCRKRLDGHNRRRRKPPPGSLNSGSFIIDHQGTRFTSYSQIIPTATPMSNWAALIKTEEDPLLYTHRLPLHLIDGHRQHFPVSSLGSYKAGKHIPFLQGNVEASSTSQPLPKTVSVATASSSSSKPFDSDGALSLLSSPAAHTSGINLSQVAAADDRIPMDQPLVPGLQYGGLGRYSHLQASSSVSPAGFSCSVMEDEHGGTVLVSDGSGADFHCHDLFHVGSEGASDGNYQTLPFSWQQ